MSKESPEVRPFNSDSDFRQCVELQRQTWGDEFAELVPPSILRVAPEVGGISAGVFDNEGGLIGFVFGMTGLRGGEVVHWSDMLAVRPENRDSGIGRLLKEWQREQVRVLGARKIMWSFDPLVARNAHFNLNILGAQVVEYVENMYPGEPGNPLHREFGTDRFLVEWMIDTTSPAPASAGEDTPVIHDIEKFDVETPTVRVEIPGDIHSILDGQPGEASSWRRTTRGIFTALPEHGYHVTGFHRSLDDGPCHYVLEK